MYTFKVTSISGYCFKGIDIVGRFSTIFHKGDNICDFLFDFLHTNSFLKNDLLYKEKNFFKGR